MLGDSLDTWTGKDLEEIGVQYDIEVRILKMLIGHGLRFDELDEVWPTRDASFEFINTMWTLLPNSKDEVPAEQSTRYVVMLMRNK